MTTKNITRLLPDGTVQQVEIDAADHVFKHEVTDDEVNRERDRRIAENFVFNGTPFDFDPASKARVTGASTLAKFAIANGAQANDLRWLDPSADFTWIAGDNSLVTMDAQTCSAFGDAAALHEQEHIFAARAIKDTPGGTPLDFTDDGYWP